MGIDISCLCLTYNRPGWGEVHLLEEAVMSFLLQDFPSKELLIINDHPDQKMVCDLPGVRVLNVDHRFETLSDKIEYGIKNAKGYYLCRWDDDDICLPWRLSLSYVKHRDLEMLTEWRPRNYWYCPVGQAPQQVFDAGNTHIMSLWSRECLRMIGGYPQKRSGDEDQEFNRLLNAHRMGVGASPAKIQMDEIFYLYRWGVSRRHLSGQVPTNAHYAKLGQSTGRQHVAGSFELRPFWARDYCRWVAESGLDHEIGKPRPTV